MFCRNCFVFPWSHSTRLALDRSCSMNQHRIFTLEGKLSQKCLDLVYRIQKKSALDSWTAKVSTHRADTRTILYFCYLVVSITLEEHSVRSQSPAAHRCLPADGFSPALTSKPSHFWKSMGGFKGEGRPWGCEKINEVSHKPNWSDDKGSGIAL